MSHYHDALAELAGVFDSLPDRDVDAAVAAIASARRIVALGCGRERLQVMGFAMRLFHMGLDVAVAGDMTTPPVAAGDMLLVSSGPGELRSVAALMEIARDAGATVLLFTAAPRSSATRLAHLTVTLTAQTMASDTGPGRASVLPMGSLYEGALFVLFEVMVLKLRERLGLSFEDMRKNHTNLE